MLFGAVVSSIIFGICSKITSLLFFKNSFSSSHKSWSNLNSLLSLKIISLSFQILTDVVETLGQHDFVRREATAESLRNWTYKKRTNHLTRKGQSYPG